LFLLAIDLAAPGVPPREIVIIFFKINKFLGEMGCSRYPTQAEAWDPGGLLDAISADRRGNSVHSRHVVCVRFCFLEISRTGQEQGIPMPAGSPLQEGCNYVKTLHWISLVLAIVGAVNWGLWGLFQFDLVAALDGGQTATFSRVVYSLVGLAGLVLAITSSMLHTELPVAGAARATSRL
jgi:uncharacterized membrane protein YuzA (DUF378 family)